MSFDIMWESESCEYKVIRISDEIYASAKDMGRLGWLITAKSTSVEDSIQDAKEADFQGRQLNFTFNVE